jgi:hypothetical protein
LLASLIDRQGITMSKMAIQMALEDLYGRWFRMADTDNDGRVSGGEAVGFFMTKSGLPQDTLRQVWEVGANDAPFLDQGSFRRVCQLIWYAQNHGNVLPHDSKGVVMKIVSGMAMLPPPKLAGLDTPWTLKDMQPVGVELPNRSYGTGPTGYQDPYGASYTGYSGVRFSSFTVVVLRSSLCNQFRALFVPRVSAPALNAARDISGTAPASPGIAPVQPRRPARPCLRSTRAVPPAPRPSTPRSRSPLARTSTPVPPARCP